MTPLVSICCLSFNHEPYLRECLDGFMMQKTNFAFEVLIHDDASTDKSADIIREYELKYPDIIKPIYQSENQFSKGVRVTQVFQFPRAKGKYIAMCEGDDYWTDPYKLQNQVDFLDANDEYSVCFHRYKIYNQNSNEYSDSSSDTFSKKVEYIDLNIETMFDNWLSQTLTCLFRKSALRLDLLEKYKYPTDNQLFFGLLQMGKGRCFNFFGGVYRKNDNGIWGNLEESKKTLNTLNIYKEIYYKNVDAKFLQKNILQLYNSLTNLLINSSFCPLFDVQIYMVMIESMTYKWSKGFLYYFLKRIFLVSIYKIFFREKYKITVSNNAYTYF